MYDALKLQGFDHAVVNVRDGMDDAVRRWQQFGFTLTPRGFHSAGSINHLIMLGSDYIELLVFPHPDGPKRDAISPWRSSKERSEITVRLPKFTVRCETLSEVI